MTYKRQPTGWAAAMTDCIAAVGEGRLAEMIGRARSRCRHFANPMDPATPPVDLAARADIAAWRAGAGTPFFDEFHRTLVTAGVLAADTGYPAAEGRRASQHLAILATARALLTLIERALAIEAPQPALARAG